MPIASGNRDSSGAAASCPSGDVLLAFSSGMLPEAELYNLSSHISGCETCQQALTGLSDEGDTLTQRLRESAAQDSAAVESAYLRMQQAAFALGQRLDASGTAHVEYEGGTDASRSAGDDATATATWTPSLPTAIGRYPVRCELGHGGFGVVYLAHDVALDRPVAIKVPRFDADITSAHFAGFMQEARTAARLKHPGIVAIYEVDRLGDNSCYIAMEYVDGGSLANELFSGALPAQRAAQIVAEAAAALHHAHMKGLVHRDLKPGNILLAANGQVKIADFGLAVHENQQRRRAGEQAGTLGYMSPEQVRGDVHRLDGRSDIWSLGVILYQSICGRRPFNGTKEEMADEILHRSPKPLRQIRDDIDPRLAAICLQCLAKDPDQRYSSAMDLAEALQAWQAETRAEQAAAFQPAAQPQRRRERMSRPLLLAAALGAAACLLLAIVAAGRYWGPHHPYPVDSLARPQTPLSLLRQIPEELTPAAPNETWHFERERLVEMNSNGPTLLGLGATNSRDYRLQATISKNRTSQEGTAGLFLGYQEVQPPGAPPRWTCHVICVHRALRELERELLVERETFEVDADGISRRKIVTVQVPWQKINESVLEVTVRDNVIVQVTWQKQPLAALVGPQFATMGHAPRCVGRFGLMNQEGSTIFTQLSFMSLRSTKK